MNPIATVRVFDLWHFAEGAIRVEVECPASTTGITSIPGSCFTLTREQAITAACYGHEERCDGDCYTSWAERAARHRHPGRDGARLATNPGGYRA